MGLTEGEEKDNVEAEEMRVRVRMKMRTRGDARVRWRNLSKRLQGLFKPIN